MLSRPISPLSHIEWAPLALAAAFALCACGQPSDRDSASLGGEAQAELGAAVVGAGGEPCDIDGTWRLEVRIPVAWDRNIGVDGGRGEVVQVARVRRRAVDARRVEEVIQACGIEVPAMWRSRPRERFQLVFDNDTFDREPSRLVPATASTTFQPGFTVGAAFDSSWATSQLGIALGDPENTPWPEHVAGLRPHLRAVTDDVGAAPGLPATPITRDGFVAPPLGMVASRGRAGRLYFAIRNVERIMGRVCSCDEMVGEVEVKGAPNAQGRHFLDSSVVAVDDPRGARCEDSRVTFLDSMLPRLRVEGRGTLHMRRVADDATCQQLRAPL